MLPDLLGQIPQDQRIGMVTADGAYDTRACHNAVADRGAHAVIPTRRNAKPWKPPVVVCRQTTVGRPATPGAEARNEILRATKNPRRAIWRRWSGYHRRNFVETTLLWIASNPLLGSECTVSNCRATASWHESSLARSPSYRFVQQGSTASPRLAFAKPFP